MELEGDSIVTRLEILNSKLKAWGLELEDVLLAFTGYKFTIVAFPLVLFPAALFSAFHFKHDSFGRCRSNHSDENVTTDYRAGVIYWL